MLTQPLSPYRCGADNGFRFGLYLTALYACMLLSEKLPFLSVAAFVLMAGVPVVLWMLIRRDRLRPGGITGVGALWLDGLFTFLCGGLLATCAMFVYLNWIDPDYINRSLLQAVEVLSQSPDADNRLLADDFETAISNGFGVTPIIFSMSMLWLTATSGSILALVVAAIMARRYPAPKSTGNNF